jgi:hypothetical protein
MQRKKVVVNDLIQKDYVYFIMEPMGENFHLDFTPELTPTEMLELGVFGGKVHERLRTGISSGLVQVCQTMS